MVVMAVLGFAEVDRPALWADELMTWGMATSSWSTMFSLLRSIDITIAPYYVLIHAWTSVVGTSDVALRVPSVLAMAGAAGLVGALGARLADPRVGLCSGLLFAVLPGTTRFAQEARVYALTTFAAVLATCLLVTALDRTGRWRFGWYALAVALLGALHPIAIGLLAAHAVFVGIVHRRRFLAWSMAAAPATVPAAVLLWFGYQQRAQIAWIPQPGWATFWSFPTELAGSTTVAGLLLVLMVVGRVVTRGAPRPVLWTLAATWAIVPLVALLIATHIIPIFVNRYLLFTVPAWTLLAGTALGRLTRVWAAVVLVAFAAVCVPGQLAVHAEDGHFEATRQLAAIIAANQHPGDGVIFGLNDWGGAWTGRDALAHYLSGPVRPVDVLAVTAPRTDGQLLPEECADVAHCLSTTTRLWIVRLGQQSDPLLGLDGDKEAVVRQRYQVKQVWLLTGLTLALAVTAP
jgi:mannosyltransferase